MVVVFLIGLLTPYLKSNYTLVLGCLYQTYGICIILFRFWHFKTLEGVSLHSVFAFFIVAALKAISLIFDLRYFELFAM